MRVVTGPAAFLQGLMPESPGELFGLVAAVAEFDLAFGQQARVGSVVGVVTGFAAPLANRLMPVGGWVAVQDLGQFFMAFVAEIRGRKFEVDTTDQAMRPVTVPAASFLQGLMDDSGLELFGHFRMAVQAALAGLPGLRRGFAGAQRQEDEEYCGQDRKPGP